VTDGLRFGIPAYGYPGTGVWESFGRLPAGSLVVMDPDNGPGASIDPRYTGVASAAKRQGLNLLGYVTSAYGRANAATMQEAIERYREWYGTTGVFIDEAPASSSSSPPIVETVQRARQLSLTVAINPGQPDIDPDDATLVDHVLNFEGPYSTYERTRFPDWVRRFPSHKFWHLVYEVRSVHTMHEVAATARSAHAGIVYITDATMPNPYDRMPAYWRDEQLLVLDQNAGALELSQHRAG
jgi:hypothetical protein